MPCYMLLYCNRFDILLYTISHDTILNHTIPYYVSLCLLCALHICIYIYILYMYIYIYHWYILT